MTLLRLATFLGHVLGGLLACLSAQAATAPVKVMVLGTYHFANPGQDLHNAQVDDVLQPRRQAELARVADQLARFRPTLVAVEAEADDQPDRAVPRYREFRDGRVEARRNEIDQIGFRLARRLGHERVIGIDAAGEFPFEALQAFAKAKGRGAELQRSVDELGQRSKAFEARARQVSVGQSLRQLNEPASVRADHAWYVAALGYGTGREQPGAALLGQWSQRNLMICARLVQSAKPGDRVLLVYGSGHAFLLRQCVQQMPGWQLVEPNQYLR
jgi:hypothetical protein